MNKQLYLAPVRGISDLIYRNAFAKCFGGIDVAMTPFLTVTKGKELKKVQMDELRPENNLLPIIPQIIGNSAENFIALSDILHDIGIEEINWNLGCPHPTMTKKKRGSGLLPHADLIKKFLDRVCAEAKTRLSVKVRLGLNEPFDLDKLVPIFNQFPIVEITIHPRTGKQMYKGEVDLDGFKRAAELLTIPVVYNGDICIKSDYDNIMASFPEVNKVMLGRGLFNNPFLASEIKGAESLSVEQKLQNLKEFHDELLDKYSQRLSGDAHLLQKMIGHWFYLADSFADGKKFYKKIKKVREMDKYLALVDQLFPSGLKSKRIEEQAD